MTITSSGIKIKKYSPNLGAIITGVDLSKEINEDQFKDIHKAFLDNQVLFFQNQNEISPEVHLKLGKLFGELHMHPAAPSMPGYPEIFEIHAHKNSKVANGEFWHSDVSCDIKPPLGTMLQLHILPETGGDTMFSNMYSAYNELSDKYKSLLDGLIAIHESEHLYSGRYEDRGVNRNNIKTPVANHPLIRTHPITGKKAIYVNRTFTTGIEGMNKNESSSILEFLFEHCEHVNFQIRYRWNKNDMAFWDNRCTMHRAIWDYWPNERKGRRVTIKGDKPI
ncbi:MAG: taurine dioxygenase [Alphaproteobacteria bacterium]|nr:MAG: taurine dioxygenase [Alphaproteobacteria bacterium]